jgi:lipid-binding SYLF domain-containing protein
MKRSTINAVVAVCAVLLMGFLSAASYAATAREIEASADAALDRFAKEVGGAKEFLNAAKGILIIPKVLQAGFIVGGEYGEGALKIGGKTVSYYSIAAGSFGYQIGAQQKDIILIFMEEGALKKFQESENWQAGVDGTVVLADMGAEGSIDTTKIKQPIVGFVFGQKGLMAGAVIEGSKFTRLKK